MKKAIVSLHPFLKKQDVYIINYALDGTKEKEKYTLFKDQIMDFILKYEDIDEIVLNGNKKMIEKIAEEGRIKEFKIRNKNTIRFSFLK